MDEQIYRVLVVDYENNIVWESERHVTEHGLITEGREVVNKAFLVAIGRLDVQEPKATIVTRYTAEHSNGARERVPNKLDDDIF